MFKQVVFQLMRCWIYCSSVDDRFPQCPASAQKLSTRRKEVGEEKRYAKGSLVVGSIDRFGNQLSARVNLAEPCTYAADNQDIDVADWLLGATQPPVGWGGTTTGTGSRAKPSRGPIPRARGVPI